MASRTVIRKDVTGNETEYTRRKQGRHAISPELRKVKFSARIDPHTLARITEQAKKYGMTESKYADLALALFEITDNVGQ